MRGRLDESGAGAKSGSLRARTNLNRPSYRIWSGTGTRTDWTYDAAGRLISVDNPSTDLDFAYAGNSARVTAETTTHKNLGGLTRTASRSYDGFNRLQTLSSALSSQTFGYDGAGRFASVINDTPPPLATFGYDAAGFPASIAYENGLTTVSIRDLAGQLSSVVTGTAVSAAYTHDAAGRRTSVEYEGGIGQAYTYDAAGQLTHGKTGVASPSTVDPTISPTHSYGYDPAGNRTSSLAFGASKTYTANDVNGYATITGDLPSYDSRGNLLYLRGQGFSWNREGRLSSSSGVGLPSVTYEYDALGRLVRKRVADGGTVTDEILVWAGWTLLTREILDGSSGTLVEQFRYTWGPDLSGSLEGAGGVGGLLAVEHAVGSAGSWEIRYAHADGNGNVMALTTSTGTVSARYRYSPYGELISATDVDSSGWALRNVHRFSTKPLQESGLYYYGYRYYDPVTGRWPSRDPIGERGGVNLYGFVGNDGINGWDLLGLKDCWQTSFKWTSEPEDVGMELHIKDLSGGIMDITKVTVIWEGDAEVECCCDDGSRFTGTGTLQGKADQPTGGQLYVVGGNFMPILPIPTTKTAADAVASLIEEALRQAGFTGGPDTEDLTDVLGGIEDVYDVAVSQGIPDMKWKDEWPCKK